MQIYWTEINQIIEETPEVKTYMLECPEGFTWEEGSFTHFGLSGFNVGGKPNRSLVRHMSICTLPSEKSIGITTRIKEECSEFKTTLEDHQVGDEVALFKTRCNVPLRREDRNIYLLSSGVGLATFRPLVLSYLDNSENIKKMYSLNIESSNDFLFTPIFESAPEKKFTSQFVNNRKDYYEEVKRKAADKDGLFYIVGSDEFLMHNIEVLREQGINADQIMLDKRETQMSEFLSFDMSV